MRIRTFSAAVGAGAVLAFAAAIPAAQAKEVDASHQSASALSAQTLGALEAQWRAEVAAHKTTMARAQAGQALKESGWYVEAKYYGLGDGGQGGPAWSGASPAVRPGCARQDSNLRPLPPQGSALSPELRARDGQCIRAKRPETVSSAPSGTSART